MVVWLSIRYSMPNRRDPSFFYYKQHRCSPQWYTWMDEPLLLSVLPTDISAHCARLVHHSIRGLWILTSVPGKDWIPNSTSRSGGSPDNSSGNTSRNYPHYFQILKWTWIVELSVKRLSKKATQTFLRYFCALRADMSHFCRTGLDNQYSTLGNPDRDRDNPALVA